MPDSGSSPLVARFNPLIRPYLVLYVAGILMFTVVFSPLVIPWLLGVGQWWARHYFDMLDCVLSDTALRFRKGILFQVEKTIPLENIQDVTFVEGPLLRYFHLSILRFETAGMSAGNAHAMSLVGVIDAHELRTQLLARREALKQRLGQSAATDSTSELLRGIDGKLAEIVELLGRRDAR